jgi:5-methylcytosine-specific restriction protein A
MPMKPLSHSQRQRAARQRQYRQDYDHTTRARDPGLARAKRIRSSQRWRHVRARHLARHPFCESAEAGHGPLVVAPEVDHILPLRQYPERAFDEANLMSLCRDCHARKSARERQVYARASARV